MNFISFILLQSFVIICSLILGIKEAPYFVLVLEIWILYYFIFDLKIFKKGIFKYPFFFKITFLSNVLVSLFLLINYNSSKINLLLYFLFLLLKHLFLGGLSLYFEFKKFLNYEGLVFYILSSEFIFLWGMILILNCYELKNLCILSISNFGGLIIFFELWVLYNCLFIILLFRKEFINYFIQFIFYSQYMLFFSLFFSNWLIIMCWGVDMSVFFFILYFFYKYQQYGLVYKGFPIIFYFISFMLISFFISLYPYPSFFLEVSYLNFLIDNNFSIFINLILLFRSYCIYFLYVFFIFLFIYRISPIFKKSSQKFIKFSFLDYVILGNFLIFYFILGVGTLGSYFMYPGDFNS